MKRLCPSITAFPWKRFGNHDCTVNVEIPADRVSAVSLQCIERVNRVALGLTHLLSVLILDMPQNDNILVRRLVKIRVEIANR